MVQPCPAHNHDGLAPGVDPWDIFNNAPIGIFTSTPEGRFQSVTPAFARMYGYDSPEELVESTTDIATHIYADPDDRKEFVRVLEEQGEVGNALKFTNTGTFRIEIASLSPISTDNARILLTISDTGIGIPDDKLKHLFKPFSQVDGPCARSYQGAGLGLAIVTRIVDQMNGKLAVESEAGTGTTVSVVLPFRQSAALSPP